jgi:hypothetical protein
MGILSWINRKLSEEDGLEEIPETQKFQSHSIEANGKTYNFTARFIGSYTNVLFQNIINDWYIRPDGKYILVMKGIWMNIGVIGPINDPTYIQKDFDSPGVVNLDGDL